MSNTNDLWERLARQARPSAGVPSQPDPALVSRILGRWRMEQRPEATAVEAWQFLGFRAALAAGIVMFVTLLVSGTAISEALGQGLSFLPEISQVEVVP